MAKYILKRIGYAVLTIWAVVTLTFIMMKAIPGNPFATEGSMSAASFANLMAFYKLDRPLHIQYLSFLKGVITFDFGPSLVSSTLHPNYYLTRGLPVSMRLGFQALVVALVFGILLGIIAALNHNRFGDYISTIVALVGVSVPSFIMARILITYFSVNLRWFPPAGWKSPIYSVLPTIALAALPMAQITRLMRSSMLDVMSMDYIKTARAKGLSRTAIVVKHGVRNAILPIISSLSTTATNLFTGSFVVEKIFGVPGMGDALVKSVGNRDYPVIMMAAVVYSIIFIVITLAIDLLYPLIDRRIKLTGGVKLAAVDE